MTEKTSFGKRLSDFRKQLRLSQADFANLLNINPVTLSNYERGKRFPEQPILDCLRQKTNVNLNWLVSGGNGHMFEFDSKSIGKKIEKSEKLSAIAEEMRRILKDI
jgi:transcriptional regulator with XRE-family HTH domain